MGGGAHSIHEATLELKLLFLKVVLCQRTGESFFVLSFTQLESPEALYTDGQLSFFPPAHGLLCYSTAGLNVQSSYRNLKRSLASLALSGGILVSGTLFLAFICQL